MLSKARFTICHISLFLAWIAAALLVAHGVSKTEGDLEDPNTFDLLNYALMERAIEVHQDGPGKPLKAQTLPFSDFRRPPESIIFNQGQWDRAVRLAEQFTAAANWGLAEPFTYSDSSDVYKVSGIKPEGFRYRNPFATISPQFEIPIDSTRDQQRSGWHIIGRDLMLVIRPDAIQDEVAVGSILEEPQGVSVARRFIVQSPKGNGLHLQIQNSPTLQGSRSVLVVQPINPSGEAQGDQTVCTEGDYFLWNGKGYVFDKSDFAPSLTTGKLNGNLVFSKRINGQLVRTHTLEEATANLLGTQVRGYPSFVDNALQRDKVKQVTLTIDPEIQAGSYFLLRKALEPINIHFLGRLRRGSLSIIDKNTGGILAHAGYPSFDTRWAQTRRVILDRHSLSKSQANQIHMPGSSIKVLTVAAGYLRFFNADAGLLPPSSDIRAVKQAFLDSYSVELNAPLGPKGQATPEARKRFREVGTPARVNHEFLDLISQVFLVSPNKKSDEKFERIVSPNLLSYFREDRLEDGFYPEKSRFPVLDADSMDAFCNYATGQQDTRLTTLRIACILGTACEGKVYQPYIIESLRNSSDQIIKPETTGVTDIPLAWSDVDHRRANMIKGMREALHQVLFPGGTGWFFINGGNTKQYLGKSPNRTNDYGKSGTAVYDEGRFEDSIFVCEHGRYIIAVWLERADGSELVEYAPEEKLHKEFERHPAHRLMDRVISLIDSLESGTQ